jgi:hypothetical protein
MEKKQVVAELIEISRQLERKGNFKDSYTLIKIASDITEDIVAEVGLEKVRRGTPKIPQNKQLESLQGKSPEDSIELRLDNKRNK